MKTEIKRVRSKFKLMTRNDNTKCWIMQSTDRDDADFDLVRDFHGTDILSDDFRYETIVNLLDRLLDYDLTTVEDVRHRGIDHEIVEGLVDVYTGNLTAWLASHNSRAEFCNQAFNDGLVDGSDIIKTLQCGQFIEIEMILNNILNHLESLENEISLGV